MDWGNANASSFLLRVTVKQRQWENPGLDPFCNQMTNTQKQKHLSTPEASEVWNSHKKHIFGQCVLKNTESIRADILSNLAQVISTKSLYHAIMTWCKRASCNVWNSPYCCKPSAAFESLQVKRLREFYKLCMLNTTGTPLSFPMVPWQLWDFLYLSQFSSFS